MSAAPIDFRITPLCALVIEIQMMYDKNSTLCISVTTTHTDLFCVPKNSSRCDRDDEKQHRRPHHRPLLLTSMSCHKKCINSTKALKSASSRPSASNLMIPSFLSSNFTPIGYSNHLSSRSTYRDISGRAFRKRVAFWESNPPLHRQQRLYKLTSLELPDVRISKNSQKLTKL